MNDFDAWIKDILDEATSPRGGFHQAMKRLYDEAYSHARETIMATTPKGLPGVTSSQVHETIMALEHDVLLDTVGTASALAHWFNDPDRDAPVKPTMHPDLKWLAKRSPQELDNVTRGFSLKSNVVLYRECYVDGDRLCAAERGWESADYAFTRTEVEQARRHLARQAEPTAEQFRAVAGALNERDRFNADLDNLPDYETWFETHALETTYHHAAPFLRHDLATVHELYTMFRARLLDELRQAGVIGDGHA